MTKKTLRTMAGAAALALAAAGTAAAQIGGMPRDWIQEQLQRDLADQETVTLSGTLRLRDGQLALVEGETVYYVPALSRFTGFVEGLKEGARVTVEGYVYQDVWLSPVTVTVGGESYDVRPSAPGVPSVPVITINPPVMRMGRVLGGLGRW